MQEPFICPGCGEQVSTDDPDFGSWKTRGPQPGGRFIITFVPRTTGRNEQVVHECNAGHLTFEGVVDMGPTLRPGPKHPERN